MKAWTTRPPAPIKLQLPSRQQFASGQSTYSLYQSTVEQRFPTGHHLPVQHLPPFPPTASSGSQQSPTGPFLTADSRHLHWIMVCSYLILLPLTFVPLEYHAGRRLQCIVHLKGIKCTTGYATARDHALLSTWALPSRSIHETQQLHCSAHQMSSPATSDIWTIPYGSAELSSASRARHRGKVFCCISIAGGSFHFFTAWFSYHTPAAAHGRQPI
jgi:hypothetical protein